MQLSNQEKTSQVSIEEQLESTKSKLAEALEWIEILQYSESGFENDALTLFLESVNKK